MDWKLCFPLGLFIERRGNTWTTWTVEQVERLANPPAGCPGEADSL